MVPSIMIVIKSSQVNYLIFTAVNNHHHPNHVIILSLKQKTKQKISLKTNEIPIIDTDG